jgi:sodium/potassium/calcium exchanger 6
MYYCDFHNMFGESKTYVFFPVGLFLMFIFMRCLSTTADEYLSPSLEYMTIRFGISESLAGVTILAFGNGAPDLFTAMSAGSSDAVTTMSPLLGSALFISTVVVGLSTYASKPDLKIKVTSSLFLRDLTLFILMNIYLLVILFWIKEITYLVAFSFAFIYIAYVIVVVI